MNTALFDSGNSFIDDNHIDLLEHIEHLTYSARDNWDGNEFRAKVKNFIVDLENHFSHEETILEGAQYNDIDAHSLKHRKISMQLRMDNLSLQNHNEAANFLVRLRTELFSHELFEDQNYWYLFDEEDGKEILILWTQDLKTGDIETDMHHRALINHINRMHKRFLSTNHIGFAVGELKLVYEYSKFHFSEEEYLLGKKLRPGHKESHQHLLMDLDTFTKEVNAGRVKLHHIGGYLKFWLLNHIKTFDIPALKQDRTKD